MLNVYHFFTYCSWKKTAYFLHKNKILRVACHEETSSIFTAFMSEEVGRTLLLNILELLPERAQLGNLEN